MATFVASNIFKSDFSRSLSGLVEVVPSKVFIVDAQKEFPELKEGYSESLVYKDKFYEDFQSGIYTHISFLDHTWNQGYGTDILVHISSSNIHKPVFTKHKNTNQSIVDSQEKLLPGTIQFDKLLLTYDLKYDGKTVEDLPMGYLLIDQQEMQVGDQHYASQAQGLTLHVVLQLTESSDLQVSVKGCISDFANAMRGIGSMIETFEKSIAESQASRSVSKGDLTRLLNQQGSNIPYLKDGYWMLNGKAITKAEVVQTGGGASTDEYEDIYKQLQTLITERSEYIANRMNELETQLEVYRKIIHWLLYTQFAIMKDGDTVVAHRLKYPGFDDLSDYLKNPISNWSPQQVWLGLNLDASGDGGDPTDPWDGNNELRWNRHDIFKIFGSETSINVRHDANRGEIR